MEGAFDKRIWLLLILVVIAAALVIVNDKREMKSAVLPESQQESQVLQKNVQRIVDSMLQKMGATQVRRTKVGADNTISGRIELRVEVPSRFETIHLLTALKDSLSRFGIRVAATENLRDATSSVHLIDHQQVFESIVISHEKNQKGVSPSVSRKQKAVRHKTQ